MKKEDKNEFELDLPYPYDSLSMYMADDLKELHHDVRAFEIVKYEWEKSSRNMKDVSPYHSNYQNGQMNVEYNKGKMLELEMRIDHYTKKTYGLIEQLAKEGEIDPELTNKAIEALDRKIYPDKFIEQSKDKKIEQNTVSKDSNGISRQFVKQFSENQKEISNTEKISPSKDSFAISLLERKRLEKEAQKAEIKNSKSEKEVTPKSGYLNYQLKYQKPLFVEPNNNNNSKDKKKEDFSKDKE